jgi:uncharacterized membrane protein required for colicin V production
LLSGKLQKSGTTGLIVTAIGGAMLAVSFFVAYQLYQVYYGLAQSSISSNSSSNFVPSLNNLLLAAIVVMFVAVMGWVGSIFLLRGVDFMKVDRGVGIVTFKVDKGLGVVSGIEVAGDKAKLQQQLEDPITVAEKS